MRPILRQSSILVGEYQHWAVMNRQHEHLADELLGFGRIHPSNSYDASIDQDNAYIHAGFDWHFNTEAPDGKKTQRMHNNWQLIKANYP